MQKSYSGKAVQFRICGSMMLARLVVFLVMITLAFLPALPTFAAEESPAKPPDIEDNTEESPVSLPDDEFDKQVDDSEDVGVINQSVASDNVTNFEEPEGSSEADTHDVAADDMVEDTDEMTTVISESDESTKKIATSTKNADINPEYDKVTEAASTSATTTGDTVAMATTTLGEVQIGATSTELSGTSSTTQLLVATSTSTTSDTVNISNTSQLSGSEESEEFNSASSSTVTNSVEYSLAENLAEESDTIVETEVSKVTVVNDQNRYQFSSKECINIGNGSYYCNETKPNNIGSVSEGVYAKTDTEGDKEIYAEIDGSTKQLTDNAVDDDAPYYDEISDTIVWHRLIEGRYQIMEYNFASDSERQLTSERYNNMQPSRDGDTTVWQGWIGDDWEIMTEENGEFRMLTDNTVHDILPSINGEHIVWQSFEGGSWKVKVYNKLTDTTETIESVEGGSVENPRFVLVYDTKFDNGDVETRGYDLKSGEVVPLSSQPAPLPQEIPDPEPTKEERAFITMTQQKPKSQKEIDDNDPLGGNGDDETGNDTPTTTTDIIIPPARNGTTTSTTTTTASDQSSVVDLVVKTSSTKENQEKNSVSTTTSDIPDVVIFP